jgi:RNA polymerase sigma factor (sigma-70 family)
MTIAHRKALDAHRGRRRRPEPVEEVPERAAPSAPETDPALWDAVRELPPGQRGALLLRFAADMRYADVAASLGCTEEAARQRVREGLKKLKERIRDD